MKTYKKDSWTIIEYPNKYIQAISYTRIIKDGILKLPVIFKDTNYVCLISNFYTTSFNYTQEIEGRTVNSLLYKTSWSGAGDVSIFLAGYIA